MIDNFMRSKKLVVNGFSLFLLILFVFYRFFKNDFSNIGVILLAFCLFLFLINLIVKLQKTTEENSEKLDDIKINTYTQKYNQDLVNNSK